MYKEEKDKIGEKSIPLDFFSFHLTLFELHDRKKRRRETYCLDPPKKSAYV